MVSAEWSSVSVDVDVAIRFSLPSSNLVSWAALFFSLGRSDQILVVTLL